MPSVLRHLSVDPLRPRRYSAGQVMHLGKAGLLQKGDGFCASSAHLAVSDDFAAAVQFAYALGQITERNKIAIQVTYLIFVWLAHIQNKDVSLRVEHLL